jgi:hypothetical protein
MQKKHGGNFGNKIKLYQLPAPQSLQLWGSDYRFLTDIFNDLFLQLSQTA